MNHWIKKYAQNWAGRLRFYGSVVLLYGMTLLSAVYLAHTPAVVVGATAYSGNRTVAYQRPIASDVVAGRPVRIVVPRVYTFEPNQYVDVPVDQGHYSSIDDSWTLSGYHAQFDLNSSPANNFGGQTFIYGHNNDYVFGAFRHHPPSAGAQAILYTANGHELSYRFVRSWSLTPSDVSVLNYQGPPVLLIQTCTGSFNEWRTMYLFSFEKVIR